MVRLWTQQCRHRVAKYWYRGNARVVEKASVCAAPCHSVQRYGLDRLNTSPCSEVVSQNAAGAQGVLSGVEAVTTMMILNPQRKGSGSKTTANSAPNGDSEVEYNGYIQVFMKPLEQGNYSVILGWLGVQKMSPRQMGLLYSLTAVTASVILYQLLFGELGFLFHRLCALIVPIFSVTCAFYWLALYFRKSWSTTSIYVLFCSCFVGEFTGQVLCNSSSDHYITQPFLAFTVLVAVSTASIFSTLETTHSTFVIIFVSFIRFLSCTALSGLPQVLRPFLAYFSGIVGVIGAKYMETVFKPPVTTNLMTQDGKIPVIKRRRSSASASHAFTTHRAGRRTSLPALIQKCQVRSDLESVSVM